MRYVWYDGTRDGKPNVPYELLATATEEAKKAGAGEEPAETGRAKKKKALAVDDPKRWDMILVGDEGMMLFKRSATDWIVTGGRRLRPFADVPKSISRVPSEDVEWMEACRGGPKPLSSFDYAGPLTEMVLLGNLAVRLGKKIDWDANVLKAKNAPEADELIRREYRKGWSLPAVEA